jgi:cell division protein FtsQ
VELSAGQNIFAVDMVRIEQAIQDLPNIEHVIVRKMFPDIIGVRVVERYPIAILEGEYPVLIDTGGTVLKYDLSSERVDMPVLTGIRTGSEEKISAKRMEKALAILSIIREQGFPVKISEINLSDLNNVVVYPDDMPISIFLGADRWEERLRKFSFAWNQIQTGMKPFAKLDLRFQRQIVYKPVELKGFITARN